MTSDLFPGRGFHSAGEFRMSGARVGGNFNCGGATLENPPQPGSPGNGFALSAQNAIIEGDVVLSDGFMAKGEVALSSAQIGGALYCSGGTFENPSQSGVDRSGVALSAIHTVVKVTVFFSDGFSAKGNVVLDGIQIGGDLDCTSASFLGELDARSASVKGTLFWSGIVDPGHTALNLSNSNVAALTDEAKSWPSKGNLRLDAFVYEYLSGGPVDARSRLDWLDRLQSFSPQPYQQLAKTLKASGDEDGATTVLVEMERRRRGDGQLASAWSWVQRESYGYGYYPSRAAILGLTLVGGVGWIIFRRARLAGAMAPTDEKVYGQFKENGSLPANYVPFYPSIYSLENSLPLVKLGQADKWGPDPSAHPAPRRPRKWFARFLDWAPSPKFLRWFLWIQILLGWILATLFAASVTGFIRKL